MDRIAKRDRNKNQREYGDIDIAFRNQTRQPRQGLQQKVGNYRNGCAPRDPLHLLPQFRCPHRSIRLYQNGGTQDKVQAKMKITEIVEENAQDQR